MTEFKLPDLVLSKPVAVNGYWLLKLPDSPYWELRRKVAAWLEAIEAEMDAPDRDQWAVKFEHEVIKGGNNDQE